MVQQYNSTFSQAGQPATPGSGHRDGQYDDASQSAVHEPEEGVWQYMGWIVISVAFLGLGFLLATYRYLQDQQLRLELKRMKKQSVSGAFKVEFDY